MTNLTMASRELFSRQPDEFCQSLHEMWARTLATKNASYDRWEPPQQLRTCAETETGNLQHLRAKIGTDGYWLNDWSFGQLCRLAGVAKETVNRLTPDTAHRVLTETLPRQGEKPMQFFIEDDVVRSIHGTAYTRLWNADVVHILKEFAVDFEPPQKGFNGATGLYLGERDMFAFMIDPLGWTEINGENFAPGFFVWNSEVGARSIGIQTFWFQAICQNHIVWDAIEVAEWKRKHTRKVAEGLPELREIIAQLVEKRDERKDGFANAVGKAMSAKFADDDEALKKILSVGITRKLAKQAIERAKTRGALTIWAVVDALTQANRSKDAGERTDADTKASQLLSMV